MKKMRSNFLIPFIFICFFLFPATFANAKQVVKIAYCPLDNFYQTDSYGTPYGYGVDYLDEIASYTGWSYEYVYCESWEDAIRLIKDGKADLLAPTAYTADRAEWGLFSNTSIISTYNAIMCLKSKDKFVYEDLEAMNKMTIGCSRGYNAKNDFLDYLSSMHITPKIAYYPTETNARAALNKGAIDAYVSNVMDIDDDLKILSKFSSSKLYYFTNKNNTSLIEQLDDALNEIQINTPFFQQSLYSNYFASILAVPLTEEELNYAENLPAISIACASNYFPLSYINEKTNTLAGVIPDILHMIEENSGLKFKLFPVSFANVSDLKSLLQKDVDAICPIEKSNYFIQSQRFLLSKPFLTFKKLLIGKDTLEYKSNHSYRMGVVAASKDAMNRIRSDFPFNVITEYYSNEELLNAVKDGKEDIVLLNEYAAQSYLIGPRYSNLNIVPASGTSYQLSISFLNVKDKKGIDAKTLSDPILMSILNKSISLLSKDILNEDIVSHATHRAYDATVQDTISNHKEFIITCGILLLLIILILIYAITAQHRNSILLKAALVKANEGSHAKSEFLSRMSHDIRTPMNAIVGMTHLARININSPKDTQKYLNQIEASSDYLLSILNDVLDMSSIENGKITLNHSTFLLNDVLNNVSTIIDNQALTAHLTFKKQINNIAHTVLIGDSIRLNQILINLLNNSVKYTSANGTITFSISEKQLDETNISLLFTIEDTGIGMTEEFMKKMYEPFEQEAMDVARNQASNGLGLSIVYKLVQLMNGTVHAESTLNKGTAFHLEIPFKFSSEAKLNSSEASEKDVNTFHGKTILVVEDNEINLEIAKSLLELYELDVKTASNGQEAVDKFSDSKEGYYSIIFMDIRMPILDGLKACSTIRDLNRSDAKSVPIIAMTANTFSEDRAAAKEAGMNEFLTKPLDTKLLFQVLKQFLSV